MSMSTFSEVSWPLFLFKMFPAVEKTLSLITLVAGICKYFMACNIYIFQPRVSLAKNFQTLLIFFLVFSSILRVIIYAYECTSNIAVVFATLNSSQPWLDYSPWSTHRSYPTQTDIFTVQKKSILLMAASLYLEFVYFNSQRV